MTASPSRALMRLADRIHAHLGVVGLLSAAILAPSAAGATILLSVSGPNNSGVTLSADEAAAAGFELTSPATNVTITAPVTCLSCLGGIWLQSTLIGPGAGFGDSIFADAFPQTSSISLPNLAAGTYFLIFSVDSGTAIWSGSAPPVITADHAIAGANFTADSTDPFVPASNFSAVFGLGLNLTVSGTLAVPEPSTLLLSVLGMAGLAGGVGIRRGKKSRTPEDTSPGG